MLIADLHVHSRFSRATSKRLNLDTLETWARRKGVGLMGTGDFTHPSWSAELRQQLSGREGIYSSNSGYPFILQTEISLIYTDKGKGRRIHHLVYAPDFDAMEKITSWLLTRGRVDYDGRPIFKITSAAFVEELKSIDERIEVVPAHVWTPWFGLLGAKGGYDSVEEGFDDMAKHIFALETGLSSDPPMNWRVSSLDKYALVSNSDLHSHWPWKMGREANVLEMKDLTYDNVILAMKKGCSTIEVDPGFGKYHWTGHRACTVCLKPSAALAAGNVCPSCGKQLTVGVEQRVEELADRPEGYIKKDAPRYHQLLPLHEVIAAVLGRGVNTKKVWAVYDRLVAGIDEYAVLLSMDEEELARRATAEVAAAVLKNRRGEISVEPGYDGVYGKVRL